MKHFDNTALLAVLKMCHDIKNGTLPPQPAQIVRKAVVNAEIERLNQLRITVDELQQEASTNIVPPMH